MTLRIVATNPQTNQYERETHQEFLARIAKRRKELEAQGNKEAKTFSDYFDAINPILERIV